jgi:YD repeat-containing protein
VTGRLARGPSGGWRLGGPCDCVYNAWDELVTVKNGSTTVAIYAYDALGRRITETYGSTTNHLYCGHS